MRATLITFLLFPILAFSQSDKTGIDTARILADENLDTFLYHLRTDTFHTSQNTTQIPHFVIKYLDRLSHGFSVANPGEDWQCCCTSPRTLPKRQMEFYAMSKQTFMIVYKTGGRGVSTHILFLSLNNNSVTDLWEGLALQDFDSVKSVIAFIAKNRNKDYGLHSNFIYL
jgi:hypothetical protein